MIERFKRIMGHDSDVKQKKRAVGYMALVLMLAVAGTALAAEPLIRSLSKKAYSATVCEIESSDTYVTAEADANCAMYEEVLDAETLALINGEISPYAAPKDTFNFSLTDNVWTSGAYWAYLNQTVTVSASVDPTDVEIKVGVVDPLGVYHYNKGTGTVLCTYNITKNGFHQVVVKNETTNTVSIIGYYSTTSNK